MTEPSFSPDDEIVSAVIDGVATADERAKVEADLQLQDRLRELTTVRDAVGAPVAPLDELTAHRLITQALDAAGGLDGSAVLTPLGASTRGYGPSRRPVPPRWRAQLGLGIGSAAAVIVAVLGLSMLGGSSDDRDDVASAPADSADSAMNAADDDAGRIETLQTPPDQSDPEAGGEPPSSAIPSSARSLGQFDSIDELMDAAMSSHVIGGVPDAGQAPKRYESPYCTLEPELLFHPERFSDAPLFESWGEVGGQILLVLVRADGEQVVDSTVVDPESCDVIDSRPAP